MCPLENCRSLSASALKGLKVEPQLTGSWRIHSRRENKKVNTQSNHFVLNSNYGCLAAQDNKAQNVGSKSLVRIEYIE